MTALTGLDWLKTGSFWRLADNPESMQEPDFYDCLAACLVKKVWLGRLEITYYRQIFYQK
jgi:hypothetical protein